MLFFNVIGGIILEIFIFLSHLLIFLTVTTAIAVMCRVLSIHMHVQLYTQDNV